jgi:hypothetical protein
MVIFLGAFLADVSIMHVAMMLTSAALTANTEIFFVVQNAADVFFLILLPFCKWYLVQQDFVGYRRVTFPDEIIEIDFNPIALWSDNNKFSEIFG